MSWLGPVTADVLCLASYSASRWRESALIKELAGHEPLRVVFRDNGFVSDAVKINVEQIFRQLSPVTEVKSL